MRLEIDSILLLFVQICLIVLIFTKNILSKDKLKFWQPTTFIALTFLYYTVIGPLYTILNNNMYILGINMANYASLSWVGSNVSLMSIIAGYSFIKKSHFKFSFAKPVNYRKTFSIGLILFAIGFIGYALYQFFYNNLSILNLLLSFGGETNLENEHVKGGYLVSLVDFCVAGCCMLLPYFLIKGKTSKIFSIAIVVTTILVFLTIGSRYCLIYLIISIATVYHIFKNIKPNFILLGVLGISVIIGMGVIQQSRSYYSGLDLNKVKGARSSDLMESGMRDTQIFFASGALMDVTEKKNNYIYFEPLITAICMPIPRAIFSEKPGGEYLDKAQLDIWGTVFGMAFMNYGDAFYAFGWVGIILNGLFIGWLSKVFWLQFEQKKDNFYNLLALALYNGSTYVFISRGYLAQEITILFMFTLVPLFLYKKIYKYIK